MRARRLFVTVFVLTFTFLAVFSGEKSAYAIYADRGDIIAYAHEVAEYGEPGYTVQQIFLSFQAMAREGGLFDPVFAMKLDTWDDQNVATGGAPTQDKYIWQHVEIQTKDGDITRYGYPKIAILKPNAAMRNEVNMPVMLSMYEGFVQNQNVGLSQYNQPLPFVFFKWLEKICSTTPNSYNWIPEASDIWTDIYGINPFNAASRNEAQYFVTNDIESPDFLFRSADCSSMTAWSILGGMNYYNPKYRELFLADQDSVNAIDCISPGQVATYLWKRGWVDIEFYPQEGEVPEGPTPEEDGSVSEWTVAMGTGVHSATTSPTPAVGDYCRRIYTAGNPVANQWFWIRYNNGKTVSPTETVFYVYLPNPGSGSRVMEVFAYNSTPGLINLIGFDEPSRPGDMVVYDSGSWIPIVSDYTPNTWIKIKCAWDWTNDRWDIYVNDALKRSGIPFVKSSSGLLYWNDRFDYTGAGITAYVDYGSYP